MKKFLFLAVAVAISAITLSSCKEDSSPKDEFIFSWHFDIEVVDYGGMNESDKEALDSAIVTLNEGLKSFQATVSQAEVAFKESVNILRKTFDDNIKNMEHTSTVIISIKCISSAKTLQENLSFE